MRGSKVILSILVVSTVCAVTAGSSQGPSGVQMQDFMEIKGAALSARMESVMKTALSRAPKTPVWIGYSFTLRPGVSIDAYERQTKRATGVAIPAAAPETRNVGVFLLHDPARNSIMRVELHNLNRRHEYGGHHIYWLGKAENNESVRLLQSFVSDSAGPQVAERTISAIAVHDGPEAVIAMRELLLNSQNQKARTTAAFWYEQIGPDASLLAQLVRDDKEYTELLHTGVFQTITREVIHPNKGFD